MEIRYPGITPEVRYKYKVGHILVEHKYRIQIKLMVYLKICN